MRDSHIFLFFNVAEAAFIGAPDTIFTGNKTQQDL
jgi:hypothetical protein